MFHVCGRCVSVIPHLWTLRQRTILCRNVITCNGETHPQAALMCAQRERTTNANYGQSHAVSTLGYKDQVDEFVAVQTLTPSVQVQDLRSNT